MGIHEEGVGGRTSRSSSIVRRCARGVPARVVVQGARRHSAADEHGGSRGLGRSTAEGETLSLVLPKDTDGTVVVERMLRQKFGVQDNGP